jgi:twitching motility two-component system response regulator PilH
LLLPQRTPDAGIAAYRRIALGRDRRRGARLAIDDGLVTSASRLSKSLSTRVLIVDDDPASRTLCAVNLQIEGLVVLQATDGQRGLEQARSERPDLVLTEVAMRGLNGFQLAEALRCDERTRRIPLVFVSAATASANAVRAAREVGALAYVTKPCDFPALALLVVSLAGPAGGRPPRQDSSANDLARSSIGSLSRVPIRETGIDRVARAR